MEQQPLAGFEGPIGSLWCIGRNYAAHARELGNPLPEAPVVFLKPASSLVGDGSLLTWPAAIGAVHHEVELVAVIGRGGRDIATEAALDHVAGYALGLDLTARDLQERAKAAGLPWTEAKGRDGFAPLSAFLPADRVPDPATLELRLWVDGQLRQEGSCSQMLWPLPDLIAYLSARFTLSPGDLIFTGTPPGVGALAAGDRLRAELAAPVRQAQPPDLEVSAGGRTTLEGARGPLLSLEARVGSLT